VAKLDAKAGTRSQVRTRKGQNKAAARVVINRRNGTLNISHGGTAIVGYISPRFSNPDEAQAYYEQQGYVVTRSSKLRVTLVKHEG
jgi:hypothetical protein